MLFSVNEAPSFLSTPDSLQVKEGDKVKLVCKVRGKPLPIVAWQNGDNEIIDSDRSKTVVKAKDDKYEVESTLTIDNVEASDESDQYRISAVNSYGQVEHVLGLVVNQPPTFTSIPEVVELIEGQEGSIECRATGRPLPSMSWTKGRKDLEGLQKQTEDETVTKLTIPSVSQDDEGTYTIKAKNSVDSIKGEIPVAGKSTSINSL